MERQPHPEVMAHLLVSAPSLPWAVAVVAPTSPRKAAPSLVVLAVVQEPDKRPPEPHPRTPHKGLPEAVLPGQQSVGAMELAEVVPALLVAPQQTTEH